MTRINDYYQKKQLLKQVSEDLQKLEEDTEIQNDLKFEEEIRQLMESYEKSAKDVLQVLGAIDPSVAKVKADGAAAGRPKRPLKKYENPNTGEVVETRGGNHKVLNEWRQQYGKGTVQSWQQD